MALVKGTNFGFVEVAPDGDPEATPMTIDAVVWAQKDTAPAGAVKVIEIGWWCSGISEAANYEVAIYSDNAGDDRPNAVIGSEVTNAKGTTAGWKRRSGLNIPIEAGTTYWIAVQVDTTPTATQGDRDGDAAERIDIIAGVSELPSPWGVSEHQYEQKAGLYAVYEKEAVAADDRFGSIRQNGCRGTDVPGLYK